MKKLKALLKLTLKTSLSWLIFFSSTQSHAEPPKAAKIPKPITSAYKTIDGSNCSGFPQVMVESIEGTCLGLVADAVTGLNFPRYARQAADGVIYVADMRSFDYGRGTIYALELPKQQGPQTQVKITDLFPKNKLTMPAGLLIDPEGRLYVGTPIGVYRFNPKKSDGTYNIQPELELLENGFMASIFRKDEYKDEDSWKDYYKTNRKNAHKHPLVQLAANTNFTEIYMSIGAPSDSCKSGPKTKDDKGFCVQSDSSLVNAGIWKMTLSNNSERKKVSTEAFARGLRNSLGLAIHPLTQKLFQAENSMDLPDPELPFEEINVIEAGRHYGWPYCHSNDQVNPDFVSVVKPEDCHKKYSPSLINMPAHVAPLSILFYQSDRISNLTGKMLVSWHGYREHGQKVVSYSLDEAGKPTSYQPELVIYNWAAKLGVHPQGAPVGLTELNDGRILVMDDKNKSILILDKGQKYDDDGRDEDQLEITEQQIEAMKPLIPFLNKTCTTCHAALGESEPRKLIENVIKNTMVDAEKPLESKLLKRLMKDMPLGQNLDQNIRDEMVQKVKVFLDTLD